ncbi:TetR/AcrR family transcriptional regulator [Chlorogloeopsis sp. ULAP01]|uniref:TetR/AcrR family transcriptional regulator n=1 Tax=Chlorogloeopsis sp. ULAP01 TaxID=3056483 RepID=UPI0025AB101B|nr:TetR/AcrR family transcriptional regulator [Chlorogloeopsis sp. ULAP01]MDM9382685.1 TetR/AcrR family transcriptional regulator [Chlorogloeopsis sp. ULAP01]
MNRPIEPQKKEELLERCLAAAIKVGALDSSINAIAKKIGTSGRMLVYHFGSKHELEQQIISLLETRLREKLWTFQGVSLEETDCLAEPLLEMWRHLTSPEMHGLLKLAMELNQRAIQGDAETQHFLEQESQKWVDSLSQLTNDKTVALSLFHLFQGAILDFLTTGNAQRGQQTIKAFTETLR